MSEGSTKIEDGLVQKTVKKLEADLPEIYYKRNGAISVYQLNQVAHFVRSQEFQSPMPKRRLKQKLRRLVNMH